MKYSILIILFGLVSSPAFSAKQKMIVPQNIEYRRNGTDLIISFLLRVDKVASSDYKLLIKPELINDDDTRNLRYVLVETRRSKIIDKRNGIADSDFSINGQFNKELMYNAVVPYEKWMDGASLYFNTSLIGCCTIDNERYPVLDEVRLKDNTYQFKPHYSMIIPDCKGPDIRQASGSAFVNFRQGSSVLNQEYMSNRAELKAIKHSLDEVSLTEGAKITGIQLTGTCSPEASWDYNARLANERANRVRDYINGNYDIPEELLTVASNPEDWQTFRQIIQDSDLKEKETLLSVIDSALSPDLKEKKLAGMPVYSYLLSNVFPLLRKVDYNITYEVKKSNTADLLQKLKLFPEELNLRELYGIASQYSNDSSVVRQAFLVASRLYPNDTVSLINAAVIALTEQNIDEAESYLLQLPDCDIPQYYNLRGIIAVYRNDYQLANDFFNTAKENGCKDAILNQNELNNRNRND